MQAMILTAPPAKVSEDTERWLEMNDDIFAGIPAEITKNYFNESENHLSQYLLQNHTSNWVEFWI